MLLKPWREFIKIEASGGIILLAAALLAIIVSNSPLFPLYSNLFDTDLVFRIGTFEFANPTILCINDGLMVIFFLLVGLEIKREIMEGELNTWKKAVLPAIAAIGGMLVPAFLYIIWNSGDDVALRGWAIPTATDIAFSLGLLALLGSRLPVSLKIFLTALAIFDDIGAIVIIAFFYNKNISWLMLGIALALALILFLLNYLRVTRVTPYILIGFILWICVMQSGVHATLSGILIAFAIPLRNEKNPQRSPLKKLERTLHPWVAFGVLPVFAFANAGINFSGVTWKDFLNPITIGIVLGLAVGKQVGVWLASWAAIRLGLAKLPRGANMMSVYGVGLIAGVGFTMSLFIGSLAFAREAGYPELVRIGVVVGSVISGALGYLVLYLNHPAKK